jgi:GTP-binding protein
LEAYGRGLTEKPEIVALSKSDAMTKDAVKAQIAKLKGACKKTPMVLSAHSHEGVREALRALAAIIEKARNDSQPEAASQYL